jgi:hypothetical protein
MFSQSPRPKEIKLGRLSTAPAQVLVLTPSSAAEGVIYRFDFGALGTTLTTLQRTVPAASDIADECTAIKGLIDGLSLAVTVTTPGSANVTITGNDVGKLYDLRNWTRNLSVSDTSTEAGTLADELTAIALEDNDWYGLALEYNSKANVVAAAAWTETAKKLFFYNTSDSACGDSGSTTDVLAALKTSGYFKTGGLTHFSALLCYAGAAWLAEGLPFLPGSSTFAFKDLAGVPVDTGVSSTEEGIIKGKNGNTYTDVAGFHITDPGKSAAGEYIDIAFGRDWLEARIKEATFAVLASSRKLPFTNSGRDALMAAVGGVLQQGIQSTFLAADPAPTVTAPDVADVPLADRANRHFPDIDFSAHIEGAIQSAAISGRISV